MAPNATDRTVFAAVLIVALVLVAVAVVIIAAAVAWGWCHDTLRTSEQERYDFEFERIVRRLDSSTR